MTHTQRAAYCLLLYVTLVISSTALAQIVLKPLAVPSASMLEELAARFAKAADKSDEQIAIIHAIDEAFKAGANQIPQTLVKLAKSAMASEHPLLRERGSKIAPLIGMAHEEFADALIKELMEGRDCVTRLALTGAIGLGGSSLRHRYGSALRKIGTQSDSPVATAAVERARRILWLILEPATTDVMGMRCDV